MHKTPASLRSAGDTTHRIDNRRSPTGMLVAVAVATGLSIAVSACGFYPDDHVVDDRTASADTSTQVAETSAPSTSDATVSRQGGSATNSGAGNSTTVGTTNTPVSDSSLVAIKNTVDTIVNDMKLNNDVVLAGIPSNRGYAAGPGFVVMGNDPRGTRTPTWWNPANAYYKSAAWWTHIAPWMVIFDGVGNAATNTRVELRGMKIYYKSRSTGQWILLSQGTVEGWNYPKSLMGADVTPPDIVSVGSGVVSVRPPNADQVFHGWCCARALPAPSDIEAIHITLQARLAVHDVNRPDDRAAARYLVQVGGDYYPDASLSINAFAPDNWNPGIGLSRSKLVGNSWQSYSFTTLDVAIQDPGGAAMSEASLRRAPPPLD